MNNASLDIINFLYNNDYTNQADISNKLQYSVGMINKSFKELEDNNYLENDKLTPKAEDLYNKNKVKNAIILAAGIGSRMVPINFDYPKAMIEINNEKLIERLIKQLHEKGIDDIHIVVGFQKEKFEYLIDKFSVKLHVNSNYAESNNLHSLNMLAGLIGDTYILPADLYFHKNPFKQAEFYSWYMITEEKTFDTNSYVKENRKREIILADKNEEKNKMVGLSFISKDDSEDVKNTLNDFSSNKIYDDFFWEDALIQGKFVFNSKRIFKKDFCEINKYEQIAELDPNSKQLQSDAIDEIKKVFGVDAGEIKDLKALKKGMTNKSFMFTVNNKEYIMRIPGEGSDVFINRCEEAEVYRLISKLGVSDKVIYINPDKGYKITEFVENSRPADINSEEDIKKAFKVLKKLHSSHLKVDHTFDIYEKMDYYKDMWITKESMYEDHAETRKKLEKLKKYIDENKNEYSLVHMDPVVDNYLFFEKDGKEQIRLIDWEYAAMQDPALDIAMFCIYSLLDRKQIDKVIDIYYENKTTEDQRNLIYAYIAAAGLLWSNWCELKEQLGIEFGEYSLAQYRYAKDFYKILKDKKVVE